MSVTLAKIPGRVQLESVDVGRGNQGVREAERNGRMNDERDAPWWLNGKNTSEEKLEEEGGVGGSRAVALCEKSSLLP